MAEITDLFSHLNDLLGQLGGVLGIAGQRFTTNMSLSFSTMTLQKWIRLVIVVGTYLLVRPYVLKYASKRQEQQFARESEGDGAEAQAQISPNSLRGQVDIPEDSDDDEDQAASSTTTSADWGKRARKRQRQMLKKAIEAEEKRLQELQEDDEDKDIEQYLVG